MSWADYNITGMFFNTAISVQQMLAFNNALKERAELVEWDGGEILDIEVLAFTETEIIIKEISPNPLEWYKKFKPLFDSIAENYFTTITGFHPSIPAIPEINTPFKSSFITGIYNGLNACYKLDLDLERRRLYTSQHWEGESEDPYWPDNMSMAHVADYINTHFPTLTDAQWLETWPYNPPETASESTIGMEGGWTEIVATGGSLPVTAYSEKGVYRKLKILNNPLKKNINYTLTIAPNSLPAEEITKGLYGIGYYLEKSSINTWLPWIDDPQWVMNTNVWVGDVASRYYRYKTKYAKQDTVITSGTIEEGSENILVKINPTVLYQPYAISETDFPYNKYFSEALYTNTLYVWFTPPVRENIGSHVYTDIQANPYSYSVIQTPNIPEIIPYTQSVQRTQGFYSEENIERLMNITCDLIPQFTFHT